MIELKQVSFTYQGQEHDGLRDIDLTIADGECVLFCGRSGCGKTTITRLVNGLIPQFYQGELQGRVLVDGQEISSLPMYQIAAKVGSVFQNPRTQFFNVDTDSEIAFGIENEARPPQELAERVEQTTEDLRIQSLRGRNIFKLSGGEKQKIAFASVYAMNPEIYLLDEPSSNLDMTSIQELREQYPKVDRRLRGKEEYVFSYNNVKVILSMNDIYYLSKEDKLVCFHTRRGLFSERASMNDMAERFAPYGFERIHASFLVNMHHVFGVESDTVLMDQQDRLPLARSRKQQFLGIMERKRLQC